MGTDARIKDLTGEVLSNELSALLSTLYMAVDDTSFTDAEKVKWTNLITSAIVSANTNNYQAMTPKSFYDSVATESRKGIVELASTAEVQAKAGEVVLTSGDQDTMQSQWKTDWWVGSGAPRVFFQDSYAIAMQMTHFGNSISANGYLVLTPELAAGKQIACATIMLSIGTNSTQGNGFYKFDYGGGEQDVTVVSEVIKLRIPSTRREIRLVCLTAQTYVRLSCTINLVML